MWRRNSGQHEAIVIGRTELAEAATSPDERATMIDSAGGDIAGRKCHEARGVTLQAALRRTQRREGQQYACALEQLILERGCQKVCSEDDLLLSIDLHNHFSATTLEGGVRGYHVHAASVQDFLLLNARLSAAIRTFHHPCFCDHS